MGPFLLTLHRSSDNLIKRKCDYLMAKKLEEKRTYLTKLEKGTYLNSLIDEYNNKCQYCNCLMNRIENDLRGASLDHWIPKSASGANIRDNFRVCCRGCNHIKRDQVFETLSQCIAFIKAKKAQKTFRRRK